MSMDFPRLRYGIEALPVDHQGQRMVLLRDTQGYCDAPLLVSLPVAQLLMLLDGTNSLRDLQAQFTRATGELLLLERLQQILAKLDEHLFLENEHFTDSVKRQTARFCADPVRHMQHVEKSYPGSAELLRQQLRGFFALEQGGPGVPRRGSDGRCITGLMAPHIDLKVGGTCFAHAYKAATEAQSPETWVILGTGHEPIENYFSLTVKDFATPLGQMVCDREYCEELLRLAPRDLRCNEYNHRREHSIEFQTIFLAYSQPGARIVPLLCSFSLADWDSQQAYIDEMAVLLRELAATHPRSVGFLASVDLAHIGPRYGDRFRPHAGTLRQHMQADSELLAVLEQCDAAAFLQKIHREQNERRVCGMAPLYILARALQGRSRGRVLHHGHATVDHQDSFVTFASMAFYAAGGDPGRGR